MLQRVLQSLKLGGQGPTAYKTNERVRNYVRFKMLYDGSTIRSNLLGVNQYKELEYNLAPPIINMSAGFLAEKPIVFSFSDESDEISKKADEIWSQSGGSSSFLENALLASIYGDSCIMVDKPDPKKQACLKWLDPMICFPEFDPHDYKVMVALVIAYDIERTDGTKEEYKEEWRGGKVTVYVNGKLTESYTYDEELFGGVPAVWVRNLEIKGDVFGRSDLKNCWKLIEKYDQLNLKNDRVIDYYSAPNIVFTGVSKSQVEMSKTERTVYYLPDGATAGFIEWNGSPPGVEEQLNRTRDTISEVSETPKIAFGQTETGMTQVSGVALRIMYGPLISKTERKRASWGPALIKAMYMAMLAEGVSDISLDQISIEWPDPLPENETEEWSIGADKVEMGVSKKQILREAGYTDKQIEQFTEEKKEEQEALGTELLGQFNAGKVPGNPYEAPPKKPAPPAKKEG